MSIRMIPVDDKSAPAVFCDYCSKRIPKAIDGNVEWSSDDSVVLFSHKHCSDLLRASRPDVTKAMELQYFPLRLTYSLEIDIEQAQSAIEALADFG